VLVNPADATNTETTLQGVHEAAHAMGLQIQVHNASTGREIDTAFAALARAELRVHQRADRYLTIGKLKTNTSRPAAANAHERGACHVAEGDISESLGRVQIRLRIIAAWNLGPFRLLGYVAEGSDAADF
jgi:hypothetical protein